MKLNTVLVANRGEIAIRIIRACHQLGLRSVAVYSDADRDAAYVKMADEALHIGAPEARESYLNIGVLLDAAKRARADAVHPGYGFLAENANFARACREAGLTFVGPASDVIAQMGSKIAAKAAAEQAGVPVVPGYHGADQSDATLSAEAGRVGLPLLIKASAGGGGRGMRRVDDLSNFAQQLSLARKEAGAAFGDASVLLERFIESSRHIEVQILADRHGTVLHLFERDCSIQRNFQKVIEEAPAPNLPEHLRRALLDAAVQLARTIGYDSVGTVEFIYDAGAEEFFFLEMNTRLQVEHPVTEMITGIDLVEWQLRVAGDEKLPFAQDDIRCTGWAVEARVAAEDPSDGFRPQTGVITAYREPLLGNVRIDSGVRKGSRITHHYDSMLAKVIACGRDRSSAIRSLIRALSQYHIGGVGTNAAFLSDILGMELFVRGGHHTGALAAQWPDGWALPAVAARQRAEAALAMLLAQRPRGAEAPRSPWHSLGAWRITETVGRAGVATYYLRGPDGGESIAKIAGRDGTFAVTLDGAPAMQMAHAVLVEGLLEYEVDDRRCAVSADVDGRNVTLHPGRGTVNFEVLTAEQALLGGKRDRPGEGNVVAAPMPGLVSEVRVHEGDRVTAGQAVVVLEAMKLLQDLTAPMSGVVASIQHKVGDTVNGGDVLVTITPAP